MKFKLRKKLFGSPLCEFTKSELELINDQINTYVPSNMERFESMSNRKIKAELTKCYAPQGYKVVCKL